MVHDLGEMIFLISSWLLMHVKIGAASIEEKMRENRLRWLGYV